MTMSPWQDIFASLYKQSHTHNLSAIPWLLVLISSLMLTIAGSVKDV